MQYDDVLGKGAFKTVYPISAICREKFQLS